VSAQETDIPRRVASACCGSQNPGVSIMSFRITGLPAAAFAAWFTLSDIARKLHA
jgi:hypothetical protein